MFLSTQGLPTASPSYCHVIPLYVQAAVRAPVPSCAAPSPQARYRALPSSDGVTCVASISSSSTTATPAIEGETTTDVAAEDEVKRLEEVIRQRDEEISIHTSP